MKRFFAENLPLKIISLIVGIVLYLLVMQEKEVEHELTYDVVVDEQIDDYVLLTQVPDLRVVVAGRSRHLARLAPDQTHSLTIELDEVTSVLHFGPEDLDLPAGIEVRSIFPSDVQLSFARLISRELPILPNVRGRPHADYYVAQSRVIPERIRITGPEREMLELNGVFTSPVDISSEATEDIDRAVNLVALGQFMSYDPEIDIRVHIDIEPNESTTRTTVQLELEGPTEHFALEPGADYVTVWLIGPPSILTDRLPIRATVDTAQWVDAEPGRYLVEPTIRNLPAGVRVDRVEPASVPLVRAPPQGLELLPLIVPLPMAVPIPLPALHVAARESAP